MIQVTSHKLIKRDKQIKTQTYTSDIEKLINPTAVVVVMKIL